MWTPGSNTSWITIAGGSSGTGDGEVTFRTADNTTPGSPQRVGTMTVAGQTVTITQRRGPDTVDCPSSPSVSPTSLSFDSDSGSDTVTVQQDASCSYTVSDNRTWITVPSSVAGNGTVTVQVTAKFGEQLSVGDGVDRESQRQRVASRRRFGAGAA